MGARGRPTGATALSAYLWGLRVGHLNGVHRSAEALERAKEDAGAWLEVLAETARLDRIDAVTAELIERYLKHLSDLTEEDE